MNMRHFLRMARLAKRPPSEARVKLVFGVIAFCLLLALVEYLGLWPDWATVDRIGRPVAR